MADRSKLENSYPLEISVSSYLGEQIAEFLSEEVGQEIFAEGDDDGSDMMALYLKGDGFSDDFINSVTCRAQVYVEVFRATRTGWFFDYPDADNYAILGVALKAAGDASSTFRRNRKVW